MKNLEVKKFRSLEVKKFRNYAYRLITYKMWQTVLKLRK